MERIASAAERAIAEARQAIAALSLPLDEPLVDAVRRAAGEIGDRYDGDVLGSDPIGSARAAARAAIASVAEELPKGGTVQLSFGETPKPEYARRTARCTSMVPAGWLLRPGEPARSV